MFVFVVDTPSLWPGLQRRANGVWAMMRKCDAGTSAVRDSQYDRGDDSRREGDMYEGVGVGMGRGLECAAGGARLSLSLPFGERESGWDDRRAKA